ncbi:MAG TPA: glycoside hydrolase family 2 TIM barrel-domain containing protein, partial [Bacteroidota bacterium]
MPIPRFRLVAVMIAAALLFSDRPAGAQEPASPPVPGTGEREEILLDPGWRFALGDAASADGDFGFGRWALFAKAGEAQGAVSPSFNDSTWRVVDLPHDWAVEQGFLRSENDEILSHGFKPVGRLFPKTTIGWYRKSFTLKGGDRGKRLRLRFDGVFRDCMVWLNGLYLGGNASGYSEFSFDITDEAAFDAQNVLVVRVDASQFEGWFYEGAGIYRHVWLIKHAPLHIPEYGTVVRTAVDAGGATLNVATSVRNESTAAARCALELRLLDAAGKTVARASTGAFGLGAFSGDTLRKTLALSHPTLWSLEQPYLYTLVTDLRSSGRLLDRRETVVGIRTVRFDNDKGFFLNGRRVELQGVCCHQDHAGVGSALPDRLQYYRIERLKEIGVNAYRTSHNPPTRELLDACDRLGMLVMDENRFFGSSPEGLSQLTRLVERDRNHPCVVIWSLGNEEWMVQDTETGREIALSLMRTLRELDPTRT